MAPLGCQVIAHTKKATRKSWDFCGKVGFYVGPSLVYYRCYKLIRSDKQAVVVSDTVTFWHHTLENPTLTTEDHIIHCLRALVTAVQLDKTPDSTNKQRLSLESLQAILALPAANQQHTDGSGVTDIYIPTSQRVRPLITNDATSPRVANNATSLRVAFHHSRPSLPPTILKPTSQPISHQTRSFSVLDHSSVKALEHHQLRKHPDYKDIWDQSYANDIGRLCQGIGTHLSLPTKKRVGSTNTRQPIYFKYIPPDHIKDIARTKDVCKHRPTKEDPNCTRITIRGNTIAYPGDCGTHTGSLETAKLLLNSVCSKPNARFMTMDLANFYLGTPLDRPEYVQIKIDVIPKEFINEYDLMQFSHNGWIYFEITKGIH